MSHVAIQLYIYERRRQGGAPPAEGKMAIYYDLPVFQDGYQLILLLLKHMKYPPLEYKYTLGQDIKWNEINLFRSIDIWAI
jgi:hypothetical protein